MGAVTVSTSAARSPLGLSTKFSAPLKRPVISLPKTDKSKNTALVTPRESVSLAIDTAKENGKRLRAAKRRSERVHAVMTDEAITSTLDLDYDEAASKLEHIYKRSPSSDEVKDQTVKKRRRRKKDGEAEDEVRIGSGNVVVRSQRKKGKRLSLESRIAKRMNKESEMVSSSEKGENDENEKIDRLVREYSAHGDMGSLDWKRMKIPPVLPSSEHNWLFKLMQPMKPILQVKDNLQNESGRESTDYELAEAINMDTLQLRKHLEVGRAARNKLIKHNLRLVLFVMNKHFHDSTNSEKFEDMCQAGVRGLIMAIDRFEPKRKSRLSTYGLFWIRHSITRFLTVSSFIKVSFGLESVRADINRARRELMFELKRRPTDKEIIERVGIKPERYREVMKSSKSIISLHSRNPVTQQELIDEIADVDGVDGDSRTQPALLRLAIDDVLDSLKPKESLVIRQRYGLDGRGGKTLGEIAGNLNISREMVRKHEMKALMKLKHPARVDYLRQYLFN